MILEAKFEMIHHYASFANLIKLKVSLSHEEASEVENINFTGCYTTWLKDSVIVLQEKLNFCFSGVFCYY